MSETMIKHKASAWSIPGMEWSMRNVDGLILEKILYEFEIDKEQLFSGRRLREVVSPIHLYRYLLRSIKGKEEQYAETKPKHSLKKIGMMTGCDHATVLHSCRTAEALIQTDKVYRAKYEAVLSKLPRYVFMLKKLY